jgi:IclR family pca regulon transcriptional regulator
MGKVLLAGLDPGELEARLRKIELARRGPNTIVDLEALREELVRVRARGLAVNNEELAYGLRSIAVPVHGQDGHVVAAINLAVHRSLVSMEDLVVRLGPGLRATAREISARIGFRPPAAPS